ncbi:MAG: DUF4160 domain-containing protein [Candidatus Paraimprobicoccus trichonymphae]|uniref:DUF4160 domain-containing protein n=1 Tax=Candidatus Paraimprobicoccus trichonymphae TaxID=3033793 RepID=A0AA48HXB5_9FIRM|nr:MAG: DUF4160 domain-containing protein [Candidatus Paraimprobicoccus trichonymphae]
MPVLSMFYGMIIKMFFIQKEHNPPHIHVIYGEYVGVVDIQTIEMVEGDLPPKALVMIKEWVMIYKKELMEIWNTQNFKKLPPLK